MILFCFCSNLTEDKILQHSLLQEHRNQETQISKIPKNGSEFYLLHLVKQEDKNNFIKIYLEYENDVDVNNTLHI